MIPRVHFLTGFLGTGKTTLVNSMIDLFREKRVAVLVNEFGDTGVDAHRIQSPAITELNNGQIFCSCLSGQFVEAMQAILERAPDIVLVETSGLAKPSTLGSILQIIADRGPDFDYGGMTCVIDAERYPTLSKTVNAVPEQVRYSDRFVINKIDRASPDVVREIESDIREEHQSAPIAKTSYCVVDEAFFTGSVDVGKVPASEACFLGWGDLGRPEAVLLDTPENAIGRNGLEAFLHDVAPKVFRIKGSIDLSEGPVDVDVTDSVVSVEQDAATRFGESGGESAGGAVGLVVIAARDHVEEVRSAWREAVGSSASPGDAATSPKSVTRQGE